MLLSNIKVSKQGLEDGLEIQHQMRMSKLKYHKKGKCIRALYAHIQTSR